MPSNITTSINDIFERSEMIRIIDHTLLTRTYDNLFPSTSSLERRILNSLINIYDGLYNKYSSTPMAICHDWILITRQPQFAPSYYTRILCWGHITAAHIFLGYYQTPIMLGTTVSSSHLHKWMDPSALAIRRLLLMFYKHIPMNKKAAIFCSFKWQVPRLEPGRMGRIWDISNAVVLSTRWENPLTYW